METLTEKNYPYQVAGRTWKVPELRLTKLPDGTVVILEEEIDRIHRAVANEICGSSEPLSMRELEFLCDITQKTFSEIAEYLGLHRSTLTKWRKAGAVPRNWIGLALKKWFWFALFGQDMGEQTIPIYQIQDESCFLSYVRDQAIEDHLTEPIQKLRM